MLPAVLIGALLSAAVTLPLALPFAGHGHDLGLLACWAWCSWPFPA
jgi:hypothetical protein